MGTKDARRAVRPSGGQVVRPRVPCGSTVARLPAFSEATRALAPAAWVTADYHCLRASVAQSLAASVAMWRRWEGTVQR
jgi:hypothetical protein